MEAMLISAREASALCGLSIASWWRHHAAHRIPPPVRIARLCIYAASPCREQARAALIRSFAWTHRLTR